MSGQTPSRSFLEANTNAAVGLLVSYAFTFFGLPLLGIHPGAGQALIITACYFLLSFARSYAIRRIFNRGDTNA